MSTETATTGLTGRQHESVLSSIRTDARKMREAIERMNEDREKLLTGGHIASANVLMESIFTMRVALAHLQDVFKVSF